MYHPTRMQPATRNSQIYYTIKYQKQHKSFILKEFIVIKNKLVSQMQKEFHIHSGSTN